MSSGPSGRSPFPGRGRRRLSAELAADAATNNAASDAAAARPLRLPTFPIYCHSLVFLLPQHRDGLP